MLFVIPVTLLCFTCVLAEIQMQGQGGEKGSSDLPLYWDSWERSCPPSPRLSHRAQREGRSSVSSSDGDGGSVTSSSTSGGAMSGDGSRAGGRGAPISQRSSDDSSTPSSPPPTYCSVPPSSPGGPFHAIPNLTLPGSGSAFFEKRSTPPPTPNIPKGKSSGTDLLLTIHPFIYNLSLPFDIPSWEPQSLLLPDTWSQLFSISTTNSFHHKEHILHYNIHTFFYFSLLTVIVLRLLYPFIRGHIIFMPLVQVTRSSQQHLHRGRSTRPAY